MRVVLDTNVFVSAVFFGGVPGEILAAWRREEVQLVLSAEIADEYRRVGARLAADFPGVNLGPILQLVLSGSELVSTPPLPEPPCRDPDDDRFVACAVAAEAQFLVSGDQDLLALSDVMGVTILSPRTFLDTVLRGTGS